MSVENISLFMTHDFKKIPHFSLHQHYQLRFFQDGDEEHWATIVTKTGEFDDIDQARERFVQEFQPYLDEVKRRMLFLETNDGQVVGTSTAWYGNWNGKEIGRLHWVEIIPEHQGRKLAKPLVTVAMKQLQTMHNQAYLKTQTTSYPAINMYLQLRFVPVITTPEEQYGWELVGEKLNQTFD